MKTKNVILLLTVIVLIVIVFYASTGNQDDSVYANGILKEREDKDRFMQTSEESPVAATRKDFKGLRYFAPDPKYRIVANLVPVTDKKITVLSTSDGKTQRYLDYAYATFELNGIANKLLILEIMDMGPFRGKLFLAFGDETSARETYGAGRYLDVQKVPGSKTITLDFNKAYNPYCAYNDTFSCPLPPQENLLQVAIKAGEQTYH
jgi:uncharacterized protein (DUF1684 family)